MPVCVGHRPLAGGTGVESYADAVFAALAEARIEPWRIEAGGHARGRLAKWLAALPPGARRLGAHGRSFASPDLFRTAQVHFNLYGRALRLRPPRPGGLVHWTYPLPLHIAGWINLYTVHDVIPLTDPDLTPIDARRHARLLAALDGSGNGFVTVSQASREALLATLGGAPERIHDCGSAIALPGSPPRPIAAARDYFLVCGTVEPRKNIARIAAAHQRSGTMLPLVIAGPDGWRAAEIRSTLADQPRVRWMPYQSRAEMIGLIAGARALLMPSLAEGFGLPVAEAMALGTPVITSAQGALAEVAGDAAVLVEPRDVGAIAAAIDALARDDALAVRLAGLGLERSARFTPNRFAARLAAAYNAAITAHLSGVGEGG